MKNLLAIVSVLALMSCSNENESNTKGEPLLPASNNFEVVNIQPIEGMLMGAESVSSMGMAQVMSTKIDIGFNFSCANTLAPLSYQFHQFEDGKVEVHVAAFELMTKEALVVFCAQVFPAVTQSIVIPGTYAKEDITLVFSKGEPAQLPEQLEGVVATDDVRLGNVAQTCPQDASCVTNGTDINVIAGTSGCVDSVALSYSYEENAEGKLDLYVSALNLSSKASQTVRCIQQNHEFFKISLVNKFYQADDINLHILKPLN